LAELLDRRDLSEGFRWLAAGIVFCAIIPLLFPDVHPWTSLQPSTGEDKIVSWVIGLATVIVAGKAIELFARFQFGTYLRSRLFLESIGRVSHDTRRRAGIGWWDISVARVRRFLFWTYVPPLCMPAMVRLLIEIPNCIRKDSGFQGSSELKPLQSLVTFLAVSQPRIKEEWRGIDVECSRGLDRLLLFVTLGQAFLLVFLIGACAFVWSMRHGYLTIMSKQGIIAAVAFLGVVVAKAASGETLEEMLVYIGALLRGFVPEVRQPSDDLY
jgi:hypothetical protein